MDRFVSDEARPAPPGGEGEIDVVAAVIERDGRILIARRPAASHLGGLWEFPGGKRHPGESAEAALVREIREELDAALAGDGAGSRVAARRRALSCAARARASAALSASPQSDAAVASCTIASGSRP